MEGNTRENGLMVNTLGVEHSMKLMELNIKVHSSGARRIVLVQNILMMILSKSRNLMKENILNRGKWRSRLGGINSKKE